MAEVLAFRKTDCSREAPQSLRENDLVGGEMRTELPFLSDRGPLVNIRLTHVFGLVPAVILTEIDYQVKCTGLGVPHDGEIWVGLTYKDLMDELGGIWGYSTIKKAVKELRDKEVLWTKHLGALKQDRTNYYAIDYDMVYEICEQTYGKGAMEGV
jgi:hypothetical protein